MACLLPSQLHPTPTYEHTAFSPLALWNTGTGSQPLCVSKMLETWLSDVSLLQSFSLEFNAVLAVGSVHGSLWHLLYSLRHGDLFCFVFFKGKMRSENLSNQGSGLSCIQVS